MHAINKTKQSMDTDKEMHNLVTELKKKCLAH